MSYIKIDRKIIESEVFFHDGQLRFWIWLLMKANYKKSFASINTGSGVKTVSVDRGQLIFGKNSASSMLGKSSSTLYAWLKKFAALGMIEQKPNKHFTIVTICKYDEYQSIDEEQKPTKNQPITNQCLTDVQLMSNQCPTSNTSKEVKEVKEVKEIKEVKNNRSMPPTIFEIQNYITEKGYSVDAERFYLYYEKIGWLVGKAKSPMKSWKAAVAEWNKRDKEKAAPPKKQPLPTLEEIMAEKRPDQLKRIFMIEDMEYGGKRPVNMMAIKAANGTYKLLWEVFDAD